MATAASPVAISGKPWLCPLELDVPFAVWRIDLSRAPDPAGMAALSEAERARAEEWQFNLSYAGDNAVVALDFDRPLGIDIELDRPIADVGALATLHLAGREREALSHRPPAEWSSAFLCAWTRKEACLKAWGCGLQREPSGVETGIAPVTMEMLSSEGQALTLGSFRIADDLIGAWAQI
jgi:4'-phosphopantetheinyl transferase